MVIWEENNESFCEFKGEKSEVKEDDYVDKDGDDDDDVDGLSFENLFKSGLKVETNRRVTVVGIIVVSHCSSLIR